MKEKIAVITGGATGIGRKTAHLLAQAGIAVAVTYRKSKTEAEALIDEIERLYGASGLAVKGDVSQEAECVEAVDTIIKAYGKIDILIHNAGPYIHERKTMIDYTSEEWNYLMNGNLNGFFYMAKEIVPHMRRNKWGRIVTFGFERSETAPGWIYRSAFAAAKTGLTSLTKTLALEEAVNGITVNMVCPGDITGDWKESDIEKAKKHQDEAVPVGRPGTGEDLARVIRFLCDEKSDFITGSVIPVTGGKDVLNKIYQE
ncbi:MULTISPECIES: SDR family oxidoreductase [unclassified Bacillus (in: firmicutes)]|uniref:SDR family oxidoreductase n=1 Tax=unclassified Bacillus (in: firmicutes) TaxID=185979 RepID=UPI000E3D3746|nr:MULTISPECIES: SDR family oxidoreductase [unclassified Bacillus (in: firmicutes)]RFU60395.1 SDR family oxidoreductase [Bacillus sp. V59.32b]CAH0347323.1 3-oxoacyl-[acyl-carrier-protein] reductase FabG [Bacillus sp. CECT 9360]